ncbi:hypothetical protein HDV02_003602 [Globomyces sp. JEL0801]|nr:hypothetical protein HDV02_003602 [Globomyces sp. JEL0801]
MNNNQSTLDRLGKVKAPYLPYVKDHVENEFGDYIYWSKQKLPDIDIPIEKDPVPEIALPPKCELSINNQSVKVTANTNVLNNQYLIQTEQHNHTTINNTVNKTSTTNQYIQINNNPQNDTDLELERLKLKYLQKELLEEKQKLLTTNNRNEELIINLNKKIDSIKSGNGDHQTIVINQNTIHQNSNNQNVLLNTNEFNHAESRVMNNYTGVNFNTQNGHQVYSQQERVAAERYPNFSRDVILSNENFNQTVSNHACNYSGIDFNEQNKLQIYSQHDRMQIPITERSYGSGKDIPVSCGNLPDVRKAYQIPPSNTPLPTPDPQRSGLKHEAHYDDSQRLGLEYESYQDKVISANQPILPGASRIEKNNAGDKIQQIKENKRVPNVDRIEVFSGKGYNPIPSSNATQNRKVNILQLEKSFKSNNTVFSADEVDSTNREKILEKNTPYWKYLQVFRAVVFTAHSFYTTYPGISNPLVIQLGGQHLLIALLISNVIDLVVTIVKAWPKTFWCCWDTENWDSVSYFDIDGSDQILAKHLVTDSRP